MPTSHVNHAMQQLRGVIFQHNAAGLTDAQLLESYLACRDEAAFAALLRRHGPMVWGVCRRLLPNYQDAEDAFQATFLVLVRRAAAITPREMLPNFLYGVASQVALKAKSIADRRRARERQLAEAPEPAAVERDLPEELPPLLDQELRLLPGKYRTPIVLCDLEGKTRKEAAQQLGWPEGTLSSRLARGRTLLAGRLTRRGLTLSAGALAATMARNAASAQVPAALASATIKNAGVFAAEQAPAAGVISDRILTLAEGAWKSMLLSKLKIGTVVLCLLALVAGVGYSLSPAPADDHASSGPPAATPAAPAKENKQEDCAIQGVWSLVSAEKEGKALPFEPGSVQVFITHSYLIWKEGAKDRGFTYALDPTKKPKQIDLTSLVEGQNGTKFVGIYEVEGNVLKICEADGQERPADFASKPGSGRTLFVCRREPGNDQRSASGLRRCSRTD